MPKNDGQGSGRSGEPRRPAPSTVGLAERFGRYHIKKKLGGGDMGAVYLAHDSEQDREVVLKAPHFSDRDDPDVREIPERGASGGDAGSSQPVPDLCRGRAGRRLLPDHALPQGHAAVGLRRAPQPSRKVVEVVAKLALALEAAHVKNVIHRDLKPDNVMMCGSAGPIVLGFALTRQARQQNRPSTQTGTTSYMPPEQVRGEPDRMACLRCVQPGRDPL